MFTDGIATKGFLDGGSSLAEVAWLDEADLFQDMTLELLSALMKTTKYTNKTSNKNTYKNSQRPNILKRDGVQL